MIYILKNKEIRKNYYGMRWSNSNIFVISILKFSKRWCLIYNLAIGGINSQVSMKRKTNVVYTFLYNYTFNIQKEYYLKKNYIHEVYVITCYTCIIISFGKGIEVSPATTHIIFFCEETEAVMWEENSRII